MIERLLQAEAALDKGLLDVAGRLYLQVSQADPRNAIALVGLARIALREDRVEDARELAEQALAIDPDEAAAQRLLREAYGEAAAAEPIEEAERPVESAAAFAAAQRRLLEAASGPATGVATGAGGPGGPGGAGGTGGTAAPAARARRRPSLLARLRHWLLGRGGH